MASAFVFDNAFVVKDFIFNLLDFENPDSLQLSIR